MIDGIANKSVYIFDVDGTLYNKTSMRITMAYRLGVYYLFHLKKIRELKCLYLFRRNREKIEYKEYSIEELASVTAKQVNILPQTAYDTVQKWMFSVPLSCIYKCRYKQVCEFINHMHAEEKQILIYSDYPALDKVNCLQLNVSTIYTAEDEEIGELKPSEKAMRHILRMHNAVAEDCLYVGDRDEKDRASAETVGISYYDIKRFRKLLRK